MLSKKISLAPAILSSVLLVACGGGGGGGSTPSTPDPGTTQPTPTPNPSPNPNPNPNPGQGLDQALFSANADINSGNELWITDGTDAGTTMVKDINAAGDSNPSQFTKVGNRWFFRANDGIHGEELWVTDGTDAGTTMVKDIRPNADSAFPDYLVAFGNNVMFAASNGVNGWELWMSDGTDAGTRMIKDIYPGATGSNIKDLTLFNNQVYFSAKDTTSLGAELWYSDGTEAGTVLADRTTGIVPLLGQHSGSIPDLLTPFGNYLVMTVSGFTKTQQNDPFDLEPYYIGATNNYHKMRDIRPGPNGSRPLEYTVAGNTLYFLADDGNGRNIWGTQDVTTGVTVQTAFPGGNLSAAPAQLTAVGNKLFFVGTTAADGTELWVIDNFNTAPRMIKDINPGVAGSRLRNLNDLNGQLMFIARDHIGEDAIWISDGTDAGTVEVSKISATGSDPDLKQFIELNDKMLFSADDDVNGAELWSTEGTAVTTVLIKDINTGGDGSPQFILPRQNQPAP